MMKVLYRRAFILLSGGLAVTLFVVFGVVIFSKTPIQANQVGTSALVLPMVQGTLEKASMEDGYGGGIRLPIAYKKIKEYTPTFDDYYAYISKINKENVAQGRTPLTKQEIIRIIRAIEKYCVEYNTNKVTIFSMAQVESRYRVRIPSRLGAKYGRGLLQVSEVALKDFNLWTGKNYTVEDLYTIEKNIEVGVWAFNQNYYYGVESKFENGAIIAYNVGVRDYKRHKTDLLNQSFKGEDYDYLVKVQEQYNLLIHWGDK